MKKRNKKSGFSLMEVMVGTAVFLVVSLAAYNAYIALIRLANVSQSRILAIQLADEQFEIIRNMPYVNVGLTDGIPLGVLPRNQTLIRGGFTFGVGLVIRNVNLSTSTVEASSRLIEVSVSCATCQNFEPVVLTGEVSPANLASASTGGALVIQVFDASGIPIQGATVVVQSTATSSVTNTDVTDNDGLLQIIGVSPGTNVYRITVTKSGYSTDRTYPLGAAPNPNPSNPDATVLQGSVTEVSLSIDRLSALNFSSVSPLCAVVPNFDFHLTGAKTIGVAVPKYSQDLSTGASGSLVLNSMEWDTYALTPADPAYDVNGITPYSPMALNAGSSQNVQLVVVPASSRSLAVAVSDSVTKLPLADVSVELSDGAGYDETNMTGQGYVSQTDWSGGSGQNIFVNPSQYYYSDSNIDTATSSGDIVMQENFGSYDIISPGTLQSSIFDTGTTSNFFGLNWKPLNQPALTGVSPVKLQIATNPTSTSTPWNYVGPDGTAGSYFTVPGTQINAVNNGNEFVRYAVYLNTETATVTPSVTDVSFSYTSGCTPPGQVLFQSLSSGSYTLTVSKAGYVTDIVPVTVSDDWQSVKIELAP